MIFRIVCIIVLIISSTMFLQGCVTSGNRAADQAYSKQLLDLDPLAKTSPSEKTYFALARTLTAQGKTEQGEMLLDLLMAEYPEFTPAYSDLAELYMQQGRLVEAKELLIKGLSIKSDDPVLLNNLGVCHLLQGSYESAHICFSDAVSKDAGTRRYRSNLALVKGLQGDYNGATQIYSGFMRPEDVQHNINIIKGMRNSEPKTFLDALEVSADAAEVEEEALQIVDAEEAKP